MNLLTHTNNLEIHLQECVSVRKQRNGTLECTYNIGSVVEVSLLEFVKCKPNILDTTTVRVCRISQQ